MKTILITGASRGIGFATAKKFLDEGWKVLGTSTSGKIDLDSENIIKYKLDVASSESVEGLIEELKKDGTKIDALVNNAGVLYDWELKRVDVEKLRKTLDVNLFGLISLTEKLIPNIKSPGHIINISSMAAAITDPQFTEEFGSMMPAYKISKVALNMYTRTLARSLSDKKIVVSSIDPGWVKTDMGGDDAEREPKEPAEEIYNLAMKEDLETGQFWLKGKKRNW